MNYFMLLAAAAVFCIGVVLLGQPDFELLGAFICFSMGVAAWLSL